MPLRRRRSHYQQLTEFERGRVIGLREGGFSYRDIAERISWNVSTVIAFAADIRGAVGTTVTQQIVRNLLLQGHLHAKRPVECILLTPNHCRLRRQWGQVRAH
ncbi:HTH_Tnp_Tc3_2 domain-containing protein [Trichonephila clavipes]|nr:HTH_Tnp_Tc3_2 domain-containing protein [Trichonephila clavipes]